MDNSSFKILPTHRNLLQQAIEQNALMVHSKLVNSSNLHTKKISGVYSPFKKVRLMMPVPFLRRFKLVKSIMQKVRNLSHREKQKNTVSSVKLKPAKTRGMKLRRYIHRLVRRQS